MEDILELCVVDIAMVIKLPCVTLSLSIGKESYRVFLFFSSVIERENCVCARRLEIRRKKCY